MVPLLVKESTKRYFFSPLVTLQTTLELSELKTVHNGHTCSIPDVGQGLSPQIAHQYGRQRELREVAHFAYMAQPPMAQ